VHVIKEDPARKGLLVAGTERGAFISFDDGDHWHSLQLNLPVTSVRDFAIHDNDLVVGTHGRGVWVIDDVAVLRQAADIPLSADAFLFKPSDTTYIPNGGDNGTPVQKDEPQAENPAPGVPIDYYIGSGVSGPVTLEILDASGAVLRSFGAPDTAPAGGGRAGAAPNAIPNTTALWRVPPEPFATGPGMHRAMWTPVAGGGRGRGGGRGGGASLSGTFTARLTAGGKTYTQQFTVRRR
jgi:hypothetical protein